MNSVSNKSLLKINTTKWFWFTEHHFFKFLANKICTVHTVKMSALLYEKGKEAITHQQFFKHHIENFVDNEICRFVLLSASTCMPKTISFFNSCMITDASILRTLLQTLKTWFSKWNSKCVLPFEGNWNIHKHKIWICHPTELFGQWTKKLLILLQNCL